MCFDMMDTALSTLGEGIIIIITTTATRTEYPIPISKQCTKMKSQINITVNWACHSFMESQMPEDLGDIVWGGWCLGQIRCDVPSGQCSGIIPLSQVETIETRRKFLEHHLEATFFSSWFLSGRGHGLGLENSRVGLLGSLNPRTTQHSSENPLS